jgi:hypothetical protein
LKFWWRCHLFCEMPPRFFFSHPNRWSSPARAAHGPCSELLTSKKALKLERFPSCTWLPTWPFWSQSLGYSLLISLSEMSHTCVLHEYINVFDDRRMTRLWGGCQLRNGHAFPSFPRIWKIPTAKVLLSLPTKG